MAAKFMSDHDRLEDVFQDEICKKISSIVDFKKFARSSNGLCLDEPDIQRIVEDNPTSVQEQKLKMLQLWKEKNGTEANAVRIRSIVRTFQDPKSEEDYAILSPDCILYMSNPISLRSRVYQGEQQMLSGPRQVAVKLAPLQERNRREADHLSKLAHHPNVVSLIQSGIYKEGISSYVYLVMELCRRENLEDFIKSKKEAGEPTPKPQKLTMSKQFLQGLQFIHSKNIIHRDIKPTNILISESGKYIKICDYGFSKGLTQGRSTTNLSMVRIGTDGYRAPETYWKDIISKKSDIFSSGLVLYFIQSEGDHAYGKDPDEWNSNIKQNKNRDLSRVCEEMPMMNLLCHMLEHEPKYRPSAEEVLKNIVFVEVSTDLHLDVLLPPDISLQLDDCRHLIEQANAIVMFDGNSRHLLPFFPKTKQWNSMQAISRDLCWSTLLLFEDHIHALRGKSMHRLEYSDPAEWNKLQNRNEDHGECPPAVVLNDSIYVCGGGNEPPTRSVEKYKAGQWQGVAALNVERSEACAVVAKDFFYCIGGRDERGIELRSVEKFDEKSNQWSEVEPTPRRTYWASAVKKDGILHVADRYGIQCMDIQKESWKIMKPDHWPSNIFRAHIHVVDDELYVVFALYDRKGVEIYHLDERTEKMTFLCKRDDIYMGLSNSIALKL